MNLSLLAAKQAQGAGSMWTLIIIYAIIFVGIYFVLIRPKSKKNKQEQELRNNLEIGDQVTTIGGIVGRIISIREDDDEFVLETGAEKTKLVFKRWAISTINTEKEKTTEKPEKKSFFGRKKKAEDNSNPAEK